MFSGKIRFLFHEQNRISQGTGECFSGLMWHPKDTPLGHNKHSIIFLNRFSILLSIVLDRKSDWLSFVQPIKDYSLYMDPQLVWFLEASFPLDGTEIIEFSIIVFLILCLFN